MSARLPVRPNLDHLKNQAQKLLKDYREKDPDALRIMQQVRHLKDPAKASLAEAQLALALEYGFSGWSELRQHVLAERAQQDGEDAAYEKHILADMRPATAGKIIEDGQDRVAIFWGGPTSGLGTTETYPGDALVVEVTAKPELDTQWGMHFQLQFDEYKEGLDPWRPGVHVPIWRISCGRREKDCWSSILFNNPGTWSRDINYYVGFSSFNAIAYKWYVLKAERLGHMLRLWVDGVPIFEVQDPRPVPERVTIGVGSVCSNVRFRDVKVIRPTDAYVNRYSRPVRLFDPYAQRREVLARYPGRVVREASVSLGRNMESRGLRLLRPGEGNRVEELNGQSFHRLVTEKDYAFLYFALDEPRGWNWGNVINLDIEYLDERKGDLAVFYRTWHFHGTPTPDIPMNGDGQWKTASLKDLRDPFLVHAGRDTAEDDISISCVHPVRPGPAVREVRVTEEDKPREAYEEVLRLFDEEIERRKEEWTVWHYEFHKALIHRYNFNDPREADRIMQRIAMMAPECECISIYAATKAAKG